MKRHGGMAIAIALSGILSLACTASESDAAGEAAAAALPAGHHDIPAAPAEGFQLLTPEFTIPAYEEKQWCYVLTHTDADAAIRQVTSYQHPIYGHHALLMVTIIPESQVADGEVFDCSDGGVNRMLSMPLYTPTDLLSPGVARMTLPDGYAVKLRQGARLMVQSHYVNYSGEDITLRDGINVATMPVADVKTWAAILVNNAFNFKVPGATEEYTTQATCAIPKDLDILFMAGHMHEFGTRFSVDRKKADGTEDRIYDVPKWDPAFRDLPPLVHHSPGTFGLTTTDHWTVSCAWANQTGNELGFPTEMCAVVAMAAPLEKAAVCNDGEYMDAGF